MIQPESRVAWKNSYSSHEEEQEPYSKGNSWHRKVGLRTLGYTVVKRNSQKGDKCKVCWKDVQYKFIMNRNPGISTGQSFLLKLKFAVWFLPSTFYLNHPVQTLSLNTWTKLCHLFLLCNSLLSSSLHAACPRHSSAEIRRHFSGLSYGTAQSGLHHRNSSTASGSIYFNIVSDFPFMFPSLCVLCDWIFCTELTVCLWWLHD